MTLIPESKACKLKEHDFFTLKYSLNPVDFAEILHPQARTYSSVPGILTETWAFILLISPKNRSGECNSRLCI